MSFIEDRFYRRDKHEYELESNDAFIKWLVMSVNSGTRCDRYTKFKDMQGLIDDLSNFYQIKYPDFTLEEIPKNPFGEKVRRLGNLDINLTVPQIILRLPWREKKIMECTYGVFGNSSGNYEEIENGRKIYKGWVGLRLQDKREKRDYSILFEPDTGLIIDSEINSFWNHHLETIFQYLKTNPSYLDFHELEKVVNTYHFEIELRHRLLQLTALKILYTGIKPELGYERAKKFIDEMNEELGLLLSKDEIEKAYEKYKEEKESFKKAFNIDYLIKKYSTGTDIKMIRLVKQKEKTNE